MADYEIMLQRLETYYTDANSKKQHEICQALISIQRYIMGCEEFDKYKNKFQRQIASEEITLKSVQKSIQYAQEDLAYGLKKHPDRAQEFQQKYDKQIVKLNEKLITTKTKLQKLNQQFESVKPISPNLVSEARAAVNTIQTIDPVLMKQLMEHELIDKQISPVALKNNLAAVKPEMESKKPDSPQEKDRVISREELNKILNDYKSTSLFSKMGMLKADRSDAIQGLKDLAKKNITISVADIKSVLKKDSDHRLNLFMDVNEKPNKTSTDDVIVKLREKFMGNVLAEKSSVKLSKK